MLSENLRDDYDSDEEYEAAIEVARESYERSKLLHGKGENEMSSARETMRRTVMVMDPSKMADPSNPTKAELDEHGVDISASVVMGEFTPAPSKPDTPDRVTWQQVRANRGGWPSHWRGHGNPIPVPGGALVLVSMPSKSAGRIVTTVMSWEVDGTLAVVKVGNQPAIYATVKDARTAALDFAERLARA